MTGYTDTVEYTAGVAAGAPIADESITVSVTAGGVFGEGLYQINGEDLQYRKLVTIDGSQVTTETGIPLMLNINLPGVKSAGADVRLATTVGTPIAREIECTDVPNSDDVTIHYPFDTIASTDSQFYVYWGNAALTEPAADSTYGSEAVWGDFDAVYLLNTAPGTIYDSTDGDYDGTGTGTLGDSDHGKDVSFVGASSQEITVGRISEIESVEKYSIRLRLSQDTLDEYDGIIGKGDGASTGNGVSIYTFTDGNMYIHPAATGSVSANGHFDYSAYLSAGVYSTIDIVFDGAGAANADRLKVFIDSSQVTLTFTGTIPTMSGNSTSDFTIGRDVYVSVSHYLDGGMDFVSVIAAANTENEHITTHKNLNNPTASGASPFYLSFGATQEATGLGVDAVATYVFSQTITAGGTFAATASDPGLVSFSASGSVAVTPVMTYAESLYIAASGALEADCVCYGNVFIDFGAAGSIDASLEIPVLVELSAAGAVSAAPVMSYVDSQQVTAAGAFSFIDNITAFDTVAFGGAGLAEAQLTYLLSVDFAGAGSGEAVPVTAYTVAAEFGGGGEFATPIVYIFINLNNLNTVGWSVAKTIQDPLWKLSAQLTGTDVPTPFRHLRAIAPDHNDVDRTVFIGFLPQARTNLSGAGNFTSLSGFDYAWYLTSQYIAEAQRITDEDTDPSVTITNILGGDDWAKTTGIEAYNMDTVTDWASIKKSYIFDPNASKWKCIQEICEHTNHIFVVKWVDTGTDFHPVAYFVHEDDIDTELDVPALVTITAPDTEFVSASKESQQVDKINRVVVKGANKITGVWYDSVVESAEVTAGEEIPIEYRYESTDLDTQAKADARATELYAFYNTDSDTYTINFKQRMDLELYQRIQFSGYDDIATGVMRIISIRYGRKAADSDVEIVVAPDQNLSNLRALSRLLGDDFMNTQDRIKEQFFIDLTKIAVGTVQSVDGDEVVVALERDGGLVKGRALS